MSAKTSLGLIKGLLLKFSKESKENPTATYSVRELEMLFSEKLRELNKLEGEEEKIRKKLRNISVEGWKGGDELIIEKIGTKWHITEHRQDKLSGEVATISHKIPEENVEKLWVIIKNICDSIGKSTTYRKLVPSVIETYHFPIELEEFNGGKNRNSFYFPYYYYCIKVLEHLNFIRYGGRGKILRLV